MLPLWRRSVEATHDFLAPGDLDFYQSAVINALQYLEVWGAFNESGLAGFMALDKRTLSMLFVDPLFLGKGVGKALLKRAMELKGSLQVYVNQQNPKAWEFYLHFGFKEIQRLPVDGSGRPYPLALLSWSEAQP